MIDIKEILCKAIVEEKANSRYRYKDLVDMVDGELQASQISNVLNQNGDCVSLDKILLLCEALSLNVEVVVKRKKRVEYIVEEVVKI